MISLSIHGCGNCSLKEVAGRAIHLRYQEYYSSDTAAINVPIAWMAEKAKRDANVVGGRTGRRRDSSYRWRMDLWTLRRHQEAKVRFRPSLFFSRSRREAQPPFLSFPASPVRLNTNEENLPHGDSRCSPDAAAAAIVPAIVI